MSDYLNMKISKDVDELVVQVQSQVKKISSSCTRIFVVNHVRIILTRDKGVIEYCIGGSSLGHEEDYVDYEELHGVVQTLYEEQEGLLNAHMSAIQVCRCKEKQIEEN